jgi:hypothetical protein
MRTLLLLLLGLPAAAWAAPWAFSEPTTVAGEVGEPHFHQLGGAGRRHLATSDSGVALAWGDDRSGNPQVYLAIGQRYKQGFERHEQLSDGDEAYEPALVSLGDDRWLAAWEQDNAVVARVVTRFGLGEIFVLAADGARQVTLASALGGRVAAVWARDVPGGQQLESAGLEIRGDRIVVRQPAVPVAPVDERPFQAFPSVVWTTDGALLVAWEDRRAGHTRLFTARRETDAGFTTATQLNEHNAPTEGDQELVGLGTGVMRVVLAVDAAAGIRAIWLDKRMAASGYAVWGAASADGGRSFGANAIVQDAQGAAVQQWHAALAGGVPGFVAAWDDTREAWLDENESGDVLLSWNLDGEWSSDLVVPGASGSGYQGSPAVALDPDGGIHLAWIERDDLSSPSRLRYLHGRWQD